MIIGNGNEYLPNLTDFFEMLIYIQKTQSQCIGIRILRHAVSMNIQLDVDDGVL